jgi:hypothetical protein
MSTTLIAAVRPVVTPMRATLVTALAAVLCGAFMAIEPAHETPSGVSDRSPFDLASRNDELTPRAQ